MKALDDATTTHLSHDVSIVRVAWFRRDTGGGSTVHREPTATTAMSASPAAGMTPPPAGEGR